MMGIYQRGNQWWIEFRYKGKRYRETIGPDKDLARDVLSKRRVEIRENRFFPEKQKDLAPVKFHPFAVEYLQWAKANKRHSTYKRDIYIMRIFDREFQGKNLEDISTEEIEDLKTKRAKRWKPASVNRELSLLKHFFSKAVEWKRIRENPARAVRRLKGEAKRVRYLMPDEITVLLSHCGGLLRGYLKPLVTVALHTGARKGELQNLKWPQVDFSSRIVSLLDTKNGERRDIPMNETARTILEGLKRKSEFVFPNRNGKRIDDAQIHIAFKEVLRRSGIEDFRFHDLRHTFASNLVMQGVDLNTVRDLLGHKDLKMTLRYAHLSPEHRTKVVSILDRIMVARPQKRPQSAKVVKLRG